MGRTKLRPWTPAEKIRLKYWRSCMTFQQDCQSAHWRHWKRVNPGIAPNPTLDLWATEIVKIEEKLVAMHEARKATS